MNTRPDTCRADDDAELLQMQTLLEQAHQAITSRIGRKDPNELAAVTPQSMQDRMAEGQTEATASEQARAVPMEEPGSRKASVETGLPQPIFGQQPNSLPAVLLHHEPPMSKPQQTLVPAEKVAHLLMFSQLCCSRVCSWQESNVALLFWLSRAALDILH